MAVAMKNLLSFLRTDEIVMVSRLNVSFVTETNPENKLYSDRVIALAM